MSRDTDLNMSKSLDIILYICAEGLEIRKEMNIGYCGLEETHTEIAEFYKEYARYYKLIK